VVKTLQTTNPAEDLRSKALDPEPAPAIEREPRYHPRSHYLPDPSQTYLATPGVRSYRGACTGCGAAESKFCPSSCSQTDPLGNFNVLDKMRPCARCVAATKRQAISMEQQFQGAALVLDSSPVIHLVLLGRPYSVCGLIARAGAVEYLTA